MSPVQRGTLDPDALAALEEERDFLLRSIDDLERERAAGDIDDDDYAELLDSYTVRTAEVLRAIDERREAFAAAAPPRSRARVVAAVAGVVVVAVIAGVLVAQAAGRRAPGDTLSGGDDVPRTPTQEAQECVSLSATSPADAVGCFQAVLDKDPENPTALTYLAWTLVLASSSLPEDTAAEALDGARGFLARAVEADPTFPDAWAFTAVLAARERRWQDAAAALDRLDALDPPAQITALVASIRADVEAGLAATDGSTTSAPATTVPTTDATGPPTTVG